MNEYILMADVIGSSNYTSSKLMKDFKSLVNLTNKNFGSKISSPLTITLGDEFQGIMQDLEAAIEVMIFMEERILEKSFDFKLRYILNEGAVDTKINKNNAYEMLGAGLTFARKMLNSMKKENNRFQVFLDNPQLGTKLFRHFILLQYFIDSWNSKDRSTVTSFLRGLNYKEVAKLEDKDQSSLWRRHKSLAIDEYNICKTLIMDVINE